MFTTDIGYGPGRTETKETTKQPSDNQDWEDFQTELGELLKELTVAYVQCKENIIATKRKVNCFLLSNLTKFDDVGRLTTFLRHTECPFTINLIERRINALLISEIKNTTNQKLWGLLESAPKSSPSQLMIIEKLSSQEEDPHNLWKLYKQTPSCSKEAIFIERKLMILLLRLMKQVNDVAMLKKLIQYIPPNNNDLEQRFVEKINSLQRKKSKL